ncbi:putative lipoprotein [Escherichia coli STEC_S1191]|nr:putative lipoprotein [Escherichia coli STEC_S1191]
MKNNGLFFVLSTYCHSDSKPALFNAGFVYVVKAVWCRRVVVGLFP